MSLSKRDILRRVMPLALLLLGLSQMVGDLAGLPMLKGFGAATMLAPAPRVFSTVKGLETFTTGFTLVWQTPEGEARTLVVDREAYEGLQGPYNRRNAYGAIMAYGPVLASNAVTQPMFEAGAQYAFCEGGPVWQELGVPVSEQGRAVTVRYTPRPGLVLTEVPGSLEVVCR